MGKDCLTFASPSLAVHPVAEINKALSKKFLLFSGFSLDFYDSQF
jgi:hypothetical protein